MKLWIRIAAPLTVVMSYAVGAQAQYAQYGTGQWGGMQSCPYNYQAGAGASSEQDAIREIQQTISEMQKQKKQKQCLLVRQ